MRPHNDDDLPVGRSWSPDSGGSFGSEGQIAGRFGPMGQDARRRAASHWRRNLRRSSSEVPPQMPES